MKTESAVGIEISKSLVIAIERTGGNITTLGNLNIENTVDDILRKFSGIEVKTIINAIRNGSLGDYGECYKITTQNVCIWIRKHLEELKGTKTHQIRQKIKSDFIIPKKIDISNPKNIELLDKILFKALTPIGHKTLFDLYDEDISMIVNCVRNDDIKKDRL